MAKIIYEFDFYEDKDIRRDFERATDALAAINDIRQWVRALRKYDEREQISISELAEKVYEILTEYNLND